MNAWIWPNYNLGLWKVTVLPSNYESIDGLSSTNSGCTLWSHGNGKCSVYGGCSHLKILMMMVNPPCSETCQCISTKYVYIYIYIYIYTFVYVYIYISCLYIYIYIMSIYIYVCICIYTYMIFPAINYEPPSFWGILPSHVSLFDPTGSPMGRYPMGRSPRTAWWFQPTPNGVSING